MEIFKLFCSIGLKGVDDANKDIDSLTDHGEKAQSKLSKAFGGIGKAAVAVGKAIGVGLAAGATAIVALGKQAITAYADYEQLVGGVETLFGAGGKSVEEYAASVGKSVAEIQGEYDNLMIAQETVMQNANNAYKTAGLSVNEYMETVTSFSASLIASLEGDTVKAASVADMAITDMSDNANKMGTSMEMIQNAYNGFAKQNYTMLDNLKLGYGGTKEEMERLLADAEKLTGTKFDISSFSDISEAIHAIQTEMGITGTTAKEAASTIQGSIGMMKASWQNLLTGLSDPTQDFDQLITNFVDSVGAVADNLVPRIGNALNGVANMIEQLAPKLATELPNILNQLLPSIIEGAVQIVNAIVQVLPQLVDAIIGILPQLIDGVMQIADALIGALPQIIQSIVSALPEIIPQLIDAFVNLIMMLVEMLPQIIQPIIDNLPTIITSIIDAVLGNLPVLIDGVIQLVLGIIAALPQIIQVLLPMIPQIIIAVITALLQAIPQLLAAIGQICWALIDAVFEIFGAGEIADSISNAFSEAWELVKAIWDLVKPYFEMVWNSIKAIFSVVGTVISGFFKVAWTAIKAVWDTVTGYFKAVWDSIALIFSVVRNVLKGNWQEAWNAIKGIVNTWASYFNGIWNSIKSVFASVKNYFRNVFNSAWEAVKSIWKNVSSYFRTVGSQLLTGLWNGINDKVGWLKSQISGVVDKIKSWFTGKKGFDEHSPSRWAKQVGAYVSQGLALGIASKQNEVIDAIDALVTDTRTELEKVMDDMNITLLDSEIKYNEEKLRIEEKQKAAEEAISNEKNSNKKNSLKKQLDTQKDADKAYLEELKATAEQERKIYEATQKDIENNKKEIVSNFKEIVQSAYDSIDEIEKAEQSLSDKLKDFGSLTSTVTISSSAGEYSFNQLADLSEQNRQLEEYKNKLIAVKERGNIPQEFFATLRDMSIEDGTELADLLLNANDEAFNQYLADWNEKQKIASEISKELYSDEATDAAKNAIATISEFADEFEQQGNENAQSWGQGFIDGMMNVIENVSKEIGGSMSKLFGASDISSFVNEYGSVLDPSKLTGNPSIDKWSEFVEVVKNLRNPPQYKIYLNNDVLVGELAPAMDASLGNINALRGRGR